MNRNTYRGKQVECRCAKVGKTAYYITKWVEQIDGRDFVEGDVGGDFCPECGRPFNLRPMTLEEAVAYGGPVWAEFKKVTTHNERFVGWMLTNTIHYIRKRQDVRFWTYQPTPEQSAAWKWEEEEG